MQLGKMLKLYLIFADRLFRNDVKVVLLKIFCDMKFITFIYHSFIFCSLIFYRYFVQC